MGNYSKDPDAVLQEALAKGYDRVRFQQGKPILDRELNLLGDLASPRRLAPYIGNGVPAQDPLSVAKPEDPTVVDFFLMPGRAIMNGLEVVIRHKVSYREQPHKENLQNQWPAFSPPFNMGWVYLRVFLTEVNDTIDTSLQNQSDIGFETSLRQKVDWELLLTDDSFRPDCLLLAEYTVQTKALVPFVETWVDRRTQGLTISQLRGELDTHLEMFKVLHISLNSDGSPKPNTINSNALQDNAVITSKIQDLAVNANKLANTSVTNAKLANGSVDGNKLAANAVGSSQIAPNAVVYGKVGPAAITVAQLKFIILINTNFSIPASSFLSIVVIPKATMGADNILFYSIWGDGDFTWSESVVTGTRILRVQNSLASPLLISMVVRRLQES